MISTIISRYNQYNASAKPKEIIPTPVEQEMLALNITVNSTWKMNCSVYLHECDLVRGKPFISKVACDYGSFYILLV